MASNMAEADSISSISGATLEKARKVDQTQININSFSKSGMKQFLSFRS